jgi:uncharacterized protein involved in type VI secretion and phage assembly
MMSRSSYRSLSYSFCLVCLMSLPSWVVAVEPDPDVARLGQRLHVIDTDPQRNAFAAYERLQARQAVQALQAAKRKQRPQALQIARIRVETAEIAARTESGSAELQRLETERSELLVEASRRDAERARAESERLRVEAQIQAEETARLREAVASESRNREEAEGLLDTVAGDEAEKLRLAREREAELARREAELTAGGVLEPAAKPKPKSKPKPKPKPTPKPARR